MTYRDWQVPARLIRERIGKPHPEQRRLAAAYGVEVAGGPRNVVAARLREALHEALELRPAKAASVPQIRYLESLRGDRETPVLSGLTRDVASAWIYAFLAEATASALERMRLGRDDLVLYRSRRTYREQYEPWAHRKPAVRAETHVISSLNEEGRVFFRKTQSHFAWPGPASAAWPTRLELVARAPRADRASRLTMTEDGT